MVYPLAPENQRTLDRSRKNLVQLAAYENSDSRRLKGYSWRRGKEKQKLFWCLVRRGSLEIHDVCFLCS